METVLNILATDIIDFAFFTQISDNILDALKRIECQRSKTTSCAKSQGKHSKPKI